MSQKKGIDSFNKFSSPIKGFKEQVFFHVVKGDKNDKAMVRLNNKKLGLELYVKFDTKELLYLTQWKMMGIGEYVLGIEPCNVPCKSRVQLKEEGLLPFLKPGEIKNISLEIGILKK